MNLKLESSIQKQLNTLEQCENKTVLIYGIKFMDFIKEKKYDYNTMREEMKKERQTKRDLDIKQEAYFGTSKVLTPVNRTKLMNKKAIATSPIHKAKKAINHSTAALAVSSVTTSASVTLQSKKNKNEFKYSVNVKTSDVVKRSLYLNKENQQNNMVTPNLRIKQIKHDESSTPSRNTTSATAASPNKTTTVDVAKSAKKRVSVRLVTLEFTLLSKFAFFFINRLQLNR